MHVAYHAVIPFHRKQLRVTPGGKSLVYQKYYPLIRLRPYDSSGSLKYLVYSRVLVRISESIPVGCSLFFVRRGSAVEVIHHQLSLRAHLGKTGSDYYRSYQPVTSQIDSLGEYSAHDTQCQHIVLLLKCPQKALSVALRHVLFLGYNFHPKRLWKLFSEHMHLLQHGIRWKEHHIVARSRTYHALYIAVNVPVHRLITVRVSGRDIICYHYLPVLRRKWRRDVYCPVLRAVRQHLHIISDRKYRSREKHRGKPFVQAVSYVNCRLDAVQSHHKSSVIPYLVIHDIILIHHLRNVQK